MDVVAAERHLAAAAAVAADQPAVGILETDLDASNGPSSACGSNNRHVSRVYIGATPGTSSASSGTPAPAATDVNFNLHDVICEKNIQAINLSCSPSTEKCVADKSLINSVLATKQHQQQHQQQQQQQQQQQRNRKLAGSCEDADRSNDSLAPLLEHKSLPQMKPNLSWKKLGESFRKVMSSSSSPGVQRPEKYAHTTATATVTTTATLGRPVASGIGHSNESSSTNDYADRDNYACRQRELLLGSAKVSNRNVDVDLQDACYGQLIEEMEQQQQQQQPQQQQQQQQQRTESPTPTSFYVAGPRSSTPRKHLAAADNGGNTHNSAAPGTWTSTSASSSTAAAAATRRRRCLPLAEGSDPPILRVHWADSCAGSPAVDRRPSWRLTGGASGQCRPQQQQQQQQPPPPPHHTAWPDNSTWDSDTPSLEIGQGVAVAVAAVSNLPPPVAAAAAAATGASVADERASASEPNNSSQNHYRKTTTTTRRGLRMGVGADRFTLAHHVRKAEFSMCSSNNNNNNNYSSNNNNNHHHNNNNNNNNNTYNNSNIHGTAAGVLQLKTTTAPHLNGLR